MKKYQFGINMVNTPVGKVNKLDFIKNKCRDKSVLDLGCVRHNATYSMSDPNWLHRHLHDVAESIVGVDYLENEVLKLNQLSGYSIIYGDVTKPLPIDKTFDVIVAGDLIEHLTNFEGFFENINKLMKSDGLLILTTPNPFYRDGFFYTFFKNDVLVNPEHTCWIDKKCLSHLVQLFSFEIIESYWINNSQWALRTLITQKNNSYDILTGKWTNDSKLAEMNRRLIGGLFELFYYPIKILMNKRSVKYADYLAIIQKKHKTNEYGD